MANRTGALRKKRKRSMVIGAIGILMSIMLLITMVTIVMDKAKATKLENLKVAATDEEQELQSTIVFPSEKTEEELEKTKVDIQDDEEQTDHETNLEQSIVTEEAEQTEENFPLADLDEDEEKEGTGKVVYLTFDDGPSSSSMKLLQVLKEYEMKATFFMLSPYIKKFPDAAKQMVFDGHAVALHGVTHDKDKFYGTLDSPLNEMLENQKTIEAVTGIKSYLIRTPYGSTPYLNAGQRSILKENGFKLWDWNVDSEDWKFRDQRYVANVIQQLERRRAEPTSVILLHDTETTVKYIRPLLDYLVEQGYETRILTEDMESFHYGSY